MSVELTQKCNAIAFDALEHAAAATRPPSGDDHPTPTAAKVMSPQCAARKARSSSLGDVTQLPALALQHMNLAESADAGREWCEWKIPSSPEGHHMLLDTLTSAKHVEGLRCFFSHDPKDDRFPDRVVVVCTLGPKLCGHKGIIHGGMTASLLDCATAFIACETIPTSATTNMNIQLRAPIIAGTSVAVVAQLANRSECGKKLTIEGVVWGQNGKKAAVCTMDFVDVGDKWGKLTPKA